MGPRAGKDKFHKIKGEDKGAGAAEDMGVVPETGDIIDSNGEDVGNLNYAD